MRESGVLMHISSLPSKYGIGTLGIEVYKFIDKLVEAKQTYWQILPINPTSFGDSPYQCLSVFAGNHYFIDIDMLIEEGLLESIEDTYDKEDINYSKLYEDRIILLKKAFSKFDIKNTKYKEFKNKNEGWLYNYSKFMFLREKYNNKIFTKWIEKKYDIEENEFYCFVQYKFFEQWFKFKKYANDKGIKIIGDLSMYVSYDSCDVWGNPSNFILDDKLNMKLVSGCPKDDFNPNGQKWGNPLYNWDYMRKDGYKFWVNRIEQANELFDVIRIDHFRGFSGYYAIAYDQLANLGFWCVGPGYELFEKIFKEVKNLNIVAEDLGFITKDVIDLIKQTSVMSTKVIQFGFSNYDNIHLPHNYSRKDVCYSSTHDNNTIIGWYKNLSNEERDFWLQYLNTKDDVVWSIIEKLYSSEARIVIISMQDILQLDENCRMNKPGTLGNWKWRIESIDNCIIKKLSELSIKYNRNL